MKVSYILLEKGEIIENMLCEDEEKEVQICPGCLNAVKLKKNFYYPEHRHPLSGNKCSWSGILSKDYFFLADSLHLLPWFDSKIFFNVE